VADLLGQRLLTVGRAVELGRPLGDGEPSCGQRLYYRVPSGMIVM
jgi:hypothetical protein